MEIYDSYELEEELYDINRSYESFCSQISTFFNLERVFNTMKIIDSSLCMESFYNIDMLSLEDDNKDNVENNGDNKDNSNNKVGFMKKAWATIKSFFRRIFGFIKNLIRKARIAVAKFQNKKWLKKSQKVFSGDTPGDYKSFSDKFGDKSDVLLTRGNSIYMIKKAGFSKSFQNLFEAIVELEKFLTSYIDKTNDSVFEYTNSDELMNKTADIIKTIKEPSKIFKCKDVEEQRNLIKEFRDKYKKDVESFDLDSIKSSIHKQAIIEIKNALNGFYKISGTNVDLEKENIFYNVVGTMKGENWLDTTKYVFEFLKKTDGYSNKIYKLMERAEKQGKEKMLKMVQHFMLLFNSISSLAFSIISLYTRYRKLLYKLTKDDRKGVINKVARTGVGTFKNNAKRVGNTAKSVGDKASKIAKGTVKTGVIGGLKGSLKTAGKIIKGGFKKGKQSLNKFENEGSDRYYYNKFND